MNTPSPLLDTFGLSQDPFVDTPQHDNNQPQLPLAGSSSWNTRIQPLARTQSGYMHPSDQMQSLLDDNERLRQENLVLAIGKAAIEEALQKLMCGTLRPQGCEPVTQQTPPVDQSKLCFSTHTQFNKWLKCVDANMKERGQLPFLEDANGKPLTCEKKGADSSLDAKSTTIATFPIIKNPLDVLHSKPIICPLPCMIPSAMTTTSHTDTSPSVPSPTESTPGSSNNALPAITTSDDAIPSPTPSVPTTNAKRMQPGLNKNGRTLCAHRWLNTVAKDAGGTTTDFKAHRTAPPKDTKQKYDIEAAQLVALGVWNVNSADIITKVSIGVVH